MINIPIFTDEAIYLRWSQIISGDLHYLYLPLTDGKPPLFMWIVAAVMKLFPNLDPLFSGRLVSLAAGLFGMFGVYFLSQQLFNKKSLSFIAVIFYILSPFVFFYSWFATADILLAAFATWSLALSVALVKNLKIKTALILGVVIGLGMLTKSPGLEFLLLTPLTLFLGFRIRWLLLMGIVFLTSRLIYSVIFFFPQAYVISLKNADFATISLPLHFPGNFTALFNWEVAYLTWPIAVLIIISLFYKRSREKFILFAYFAAHFLFMAFFNKIIYPRFLLMFTPLLFILAATVIDDLGLKFLVPVLIFPLFVNYKILTDPTKAVIADNDSVQYLNSRAAGWGIKELNTFFTQQCKSSSKIKVGVEGTFGLMPQALELYQKDHSCLEIRPFWPSPENLPSGLDYYVIYQRETPSGWKMKLVKQFKQGNSNDYLKLYKITL